MNNFMGRERIPIKNGYMVKNTKEKMSVSKRRKRIIQLLRKHKKMKTEELAERMSISPSRLSEDIKDLRREGFHIITKYGYRKLIEDNESDQKQRYEELDHATIRKFLLQQILCQDNQKNGKTRMELAKDFDFFYYGNTSGHISGDDSEKPVIKKVSSNLNRDINNASFKKKKVYKSDRLYPDENLPMLRRMAKSDMINFCDCYSLYREGALVKGLDEIYLVMKYLLYGNDEEEGKVPDSRYRVHGKRNRPEKKTLNYLEKILAEPYKFFALHISYRTHAGYWKKINLSVAYIVYVVDKNRWYLMGEDETKPVIVPLDAIDKIKCTEKENKIYHHKKYKQIAEEMLSISLENPQKVIVHFENQPFIKEKVEKLHQKRIHSSTIDCNGSELIYEDTIRGGRDFLPFLRQYGSSAIVEEPKEMRDAMIDSAKKMIRSYEEVWGDELSQ